MNAKNTVFVNLPHPNAIPTPEARLRQWKSAAVGFAKDLTPTLNPKSAVASTEEPTKMLPEQHQDRPVPYRHQGNPEDFREMVNGSVSLQPVL